METWLYDEILDGLTKLLFLSLERTPASDAINYTAMVWVEALTIGRSWDEVRDRPRIARAFVELARTREMWPLPKHFLGVLPEVEVSALGYETKPATREEAERAIATIRKLLAEGEAMPDFSLPEPVKREGPPLAKVEEDLQAHYGRMPSGPDRKSQAAGPDA